jgi:CBS domain-containing protein
MELQSAIRRSPVTVAPDTTIAMAARAMDDNGVGALVIVEDGHPTGIVTDRDITVRATARRFPPDARIDSVMTTDLVTASVRDDVSRALHVFDEHPIRRLPLIDEDGALVGMVTADDLLVNISSELAELVRPITAQVIFSHPEPDLPAVP